MLEELQELLSAINTRIEAVRKDAADRQAWLISEGLGGSVTEFTMQNTDGRYIIDSLLVAKAQTITSILMLKREGLPE